MHQVTFRNFKVKNLFLYCLFFSACNDSKTDELKIREMDNDFDKSMSQNTQFYYDTIRNPNNGQPIVFLEYIYDSVNGVKSLHQKSSVDGLKFLHQVNYVHGSVYKLKLDVLPDTVKPGIKYKPDTYMYYVIKGKLIPKIENDSDYRYLIPTLVHSYDSAANKFEERLKSK